MKKTFTIVTFFIGASLTAMHVLENIVTGNKEPILSACLTIIIGIIYLMNKDG